VAWLVLLGLHVLVYLSRAVRSTVEDALPAKRKPLRGTSSRALALVAAVISGLVLAGATVPAQHRWVGLRHGHHDDRRGAGGHRVAPASPR
jgi:hypothetical protein